MRERLLAMRVQIRHEAFVGRIEVLGLQERGEDTYLGADRRPMRWAFRHQLDVCFWPLERCGRFIRGVDLCTLPRGFVFGGGRGADGVLDLK